MTQRYTELEVVKNRSTDPPGAAVLLLHFDDGAGGYRTAVETTADSIMDLVNDVLNKAGLPIQVVLNLPEIT